MSTGRVYLVGAGCGRADLLTLRGKNRLVCCDVVVYDDLIDPAILAFAPANAQPIYMGKRRGHHSAPQWEINETLISLAQQGKVVVRLKGGDPFVFGRGGEEALALKAAGIPFEVIPGISSSIAIPAGAGIPVTHRGTSRGFHVITGHTANTPDGLPPDLPQLARGEGTLVLLMGLKNLPTLTRKLVEYGRSPATPAAIISGGNSLNPITIRGTLGDIGEKSAQALPPAVVVVGEVAAMELTSTLPLAGVRVGVTGTPSITEKLTTLLDPLGAAVIPVCPAEIREFPPSPVLRELSRGRPKWVVFTSPNGVEVFFRQLRGEKMDLRDLHPCSFAVIGPATGMALEHHGFFPDLCPGEHTSAALAQALMETVPKGQPIYLFRSARGAKVLSQLPGYPVTDVPTYDTVFPHSTAPLPQLDYLTFSSAGGVEEFFRQYSALPEQTRPVCIGAVTAETLKKHTDAAPLMGSETSAAGMAEAILRHKTQ